MTTRFFGPGLKKLVSAAINAGTATFKLVLLDDAYTFDPDHEFVSSVASNELADTSGYAGGFAGAGRKTATVTFDYDATNNRVRMAVADLSWTSFDDGTSTDTCGGAALIVENTNDSDSHLIAFLGLAANKACNVDVFSLDIPTLAEGGTLYLAV
ncbi:hypothetical protein KC887_00220 [Candidatus Kaiserbacteria bacterium]|nr:hypothetical protein [Candidatus Kaiserbacteria bacterium]